MGTHRCKHLERILENDCIRVILEHVHEDAPLVSQSHWLATILRRKWSEITGDQHNPERKMGAFGLATFRPLGVVGFLAQEPALIVIGLWFGIACGYKLWTGTPKSDDSLTHWFKVPLRETAHK